MDQQILDQSGAVSDPVYPNYIRDVTFIVQFHDATGVHFELRVSGDQWVRIQDSDLFEDGVLSFENIENPIRAVPHNGSVSVWATAKN